MKTVRIDIKTTNPSNGSFGTTKWAAIQQTRDRRKQRATVLAVMRQLDPAEFSDGCRVTMTRIAPSKGLDEHDNLRSALKHACDSVADWLGLNDNDPRIDWKYGQRRGRPGEYAVIVEVEATAGRKSA